GRSSAVTVRMRTLSAADTEAAPPFIAPPRIAVIANLYYTLCAGPRQLARVGGKKPGAGGVACLLAPLPRKIYLVSTLRQPCAFWRPKRKANQVAVHSLPSVRTSNVCNGKPFRCSAILSGFCGAVVAGFHILLS